MITNEPRIDAAGRRPYAGAFTYTNIYNTGLPTSMYGKILTRLSAFISLDQSEQDYFVTKLQVKQCNKNELMLQEGQVCKYAYFINSGYLRYYYNVDGQENTAQFFFESGWYTDYESFLSGKPAKQKTYLFCVRCKTMK